MSKITGSWDVESSTRPGMKHRVTRYEVSIGEVWRCSCEAGIFGDDSCRHVAAIKASLPPKAVDDGWRRVARHSNVELQQNLDRGLYRVVVVSVSGETADYGSAKSTYNGMVPRRERLK